MTLLPLTDEDLKMLPNNDFEKTQWTHLFIFQTESWKRMLNLMTDNGNFPRESYCIMHTIYEDLVLVWFKFEKIDRNLIGYKIMPTSMIHNADTIIEFENGIFGPVKYLKDRNNLYGEYNLSSSQIKNKFLQEFLTITRIQ